MGALFGCFCITKLLRDARFFDLLAAGEGEAIRRYIAGDDRTGANHGAITNRDWGDERAVAADEQCRARQRVLPPRLSLKCGSLFLHERREQINWDGHERGGVMFAGDFPHRLEIA